jgi:peptidoglycan/xylan/chitin deacetylase (PgdA/CDA1 family)
VSPDRDGAIHLAAQVCYGSLRALGATALRRRLQNAGLILCYHNVVSDWDQVGDPGLHVPRERFERQARWLADHYDVVSLREYTDRLVRGASLRSAAAITFDDAYAGIFEHAVPLLKTLGLPATIFVVADAPGRSTGFWWDQPHMVQSLTPDRYERYLTHLHGDARAILSEMPSAAISMPLTHRPADWNTICAHATGCIHIGAHSATHRSLPTLTEVELEDEIVASRARLHRATGVWAEFFAYPYGLSDPRIRRIVRKAGYRAALSLGGALNRATANLWDLKRVNVPANISDAAFEAWTAGFQPRRSH